jgi:hypothetical protein
MGWVLSKLLMGIRAIEILICFESYPLHSIHVWGQQKWMAWRKSVILRNLIGKFYRTFNSKYGLYISLQFMHNYITSVSLDKHKDNV